MLRSTTRPTAPIFHVEPCATLQTISSLYLPYTYPFATTMSAPTYELNRLDLHANPQATLHESSLSPDIASLDQLFSELRARWDWLHSIFIVSLRHNHRNALDASGVQQVADEIEAFDNQLRSAALAVQNCGDGINDQLEMARSRVMNLRLQLSCMRREMVKLTLECLSCFAKGALSLLSITSMNLDLEHAVIDAVFLMPRKLSRSGN
ncbi:hypothetical protein GY45DRAFT_1101203 [Cubamyces sp. BRFM 1775]|nr:hypothetical protein GY45DRAFT_1101203 [Cubamyces sp. BRFM 1775]